MWGIKEPLTPSFHLSNLSTCNIFPCQRWHTSWYRTFWLEGLEKFKTLLNIPFGGGRLEGSNHGSLDGFLKMDHPRSECVVFCLVAYITFVLSGFPKATENGSIVQKTDGYSSFGTKWINTREPLQSKHGTKGKEGKHGIIQWLRTIPIWSCVWIKRVYKARLIRGSPN